VQGRPDDLARGRHEPDVVSNVSGNDVSIGVELDSSSNVELDGSSFDTLSCATVAYTGVSIEQNNALPFQIEGEHFVRRRSR
jgi:hypothetical protein